MTPDGPPREHARNREFEVVRVLAESTSVTGGAEALMRVIAEAFGWSAGALWVADPEADLLTCAADWGEDDDAVEEFRRLSRRLTFGRGVGLPGRVWATGEPAWIEDLGLDANFPRRDAAERAGLRSAAALPVLGSTGTLGAMEFLGREPRGPDPSQIDLLRTVGRQMGQFVGRVRAEERLRAAEAHGSAIVAAALDCIVTMDDHGVVLDFNPAAVATFGYSRSAAVGRELAELIIPPELRAAHRTALQRCVRTGEGTILGRRLELEALRADGTRFPAELTVTRVEAGPRPTFAGFVRDITDRRRAELELERLLGREHDARLQAEASERAARRVSEALQRSLLPPHLPEVPGIELGAAYRAGGEGAAVGGDFYDVFPLDGGRWGVAIGDVCGKGPDAAAVTALVRYAIRTAAVRESDPAAVLRVVNDALLREEGSGDTCTAVYGVLEPTDTGARLCVAVAGHPPPLLLSAAGEVETAGGRGTLLGALADPVLQATEVTIGAGDLLLLYTDGVTEARTPDGRFGPDRLAATLRACIGLHPAEVVARVAAAVSPPSEGAARDDVALLGLRAAPR